jgi:hypothetical protein
MIAWRTGLTVLARASGVVLPADLQQAGRGEIARQLAEAEKSVWMWINGCVGLRWLVGAKFAVARMPMSAS